MIDRKWNFQNTKFDVCNTYLFI